MSLLIPDVVIVNTLNKILAILRLDYKTQVDAGHEDRSLLYLLFNGTALGKYNMYDNAKSLIITTPENPLHLEVRLSYDGTPTTAATMIYVALSSENANSNSLQIGVGDKDELVFDNPDPDADEYRQQYTRRFSTTYSVVVMSKNRNEMLIIYNLMKVMMITCINHMTLEGLENIKIGGQDVRLTGEPWAQFARGINIYFEYEQTVPEALVKQVYNKIRVQLIADDSEFRN